MCVLEQDLESQPTVIGPHCEAGGILTEDVELPAAARP